MSRSSCRSLSCLFGLLVLFSGCNSSGLGKSYTVTGKITRDGKPLANAKVQYNCITELPLEYRTNDCMTDANGAYKLENIYPGTYGVFVFDAETLAAPDNPVDPKRGIPAMTESDEQRQEAKVSAEKTNFDFDLKKSSP